MHPEAGMLRSQFLDTRLSLMAATFFFLFAGMAFAEGNYEFMQAGTGQQSKYVGPGSCSATACHGSVQPRHETKVLQNEYSTWVLQDKHAKAQQVLNNMVSV